MGWHWCCCIIHPCTVPLYMPFFMPADLFHFFLVTFPSDCHLNFLQTYRKEWGTHFFPQLGLLGRFVFISDSFVFCHIDSATLWMYAKCSGSKVAIDKGRFVLRKLDCIGISVKSAIATRMKFHLAHGLSLSSPSTSLYLSISLNSIYIWYCYLRLWCHKRTYRLGIWQTMFHAALYARLTVTGGALRICFNDCPDLGPKQREALDRPLTLQELTSVVQCVCPKAPLPLLMKFHQSSKAMFGGSFEGESVRGFTGIPLRKPPSNCQQAMVSFLTTNVRTADSIYCFHYKILLG